MSETQTVSELRDLLEKLQEYLGEGDQSGEGGLLRVEVAERLLRMDASLPKIEVTFTQAGGADFQAGWANVGAVQLLAAGEYLKMIGTMQLQGQFVAAQQQRANLAIPRGPIRLPRNGN